MIEVNSQTSTITATASTTPAHPNAMSSLQMLFQPPYVFLTLAVIIYFVWQYFQKQAAPPSGVQVFEKLFQHEIQQKLKAFAVNYPIWAPRYLYVNDRRVGKTYAAAEFEAAIPPIGEKKEDKSTPQEIETARYVILQRGLIKPQYYIIPKDKVIERNNVFIVKDLAVDPLADGVYLLAPTEREKRMIYDLTWKWYSKDISGVVATLATRVARANAVTAGRIAEIEGWGEVEAQKFKRRVTNA